MRVAPAAIWQNALPGIATVTALAIAVTAVAFTLPRYTEAWGVVVVGGAVTLFLMNQRALLVPLIILTVPLEISKIFIPILQAENPWGGYSVSLLDLSRLMTMLAIGVWMLDSLATGRLTLPRNRIVGYSLLLLFAYGFSYTYTMDASRTLSETLRLAFNVLSFLSVMHFVRGESRFDRAIVALVVTGVGVAAIAGFQYVTGIIFWNEQLILQQVARVNATFADPNSLATFMNVVIAISLSGALAVRRLWLRFVLLGAAGACALGLLFSFSRAGWLCGAIVFGLFVLLALRSRPVAAFALVCLAAAVAVGLFVAVPQIADRFEQSLEPGALSVRPYLIEAGLIMFMENPLLGVGAGAYRLAAQTEYAFANPFVWYVSASHTAIVTTMAELGIVGLSLTLLICWETIRQLWQIRNDEQRPALHQGYAAGLLLAFLAVLLQAQSVGVFFEEPYLWIILGLTVVLRRWRRTDAGRRPSDDRQQSDPFLRPSSAVVPAQ